MANNRDTLITGIGLVSSLGEGVDAHWRALNTAPFTPTLDIETFAPYVVHPIVRLELDKQIPKRGDQRTMEPWQRIGTYAAGLALDSAGIKDNAELLDHTDMIIAAGGGERDYAVDATILSTLPGTADPGVKLNEMLMSDLRPTLFLAQLSNLLAGNISVVHGVVGASRTFMGEEAAGVDAVRIAIARIADGTSDLVLVGGSYNAERPDILLHYEIGRVLWKKPYVSIAQRIASGGGMLLGSVGCFLVLESRAHAARRGAPAVACIAGIQSDRCNRAPGAASVNAQRQFDTLMAGRDMGGAAIISGASGAGPASAEEAIFLRDLNLPVRNLPIRTPANALGHSLEPSFPANLAIAAMSVSRGQIFAPLDAAEVTADEKLRSAIVTAWGHWRGEGMALVTAA
ncbi:MAG: beta-ketoacyl-ACP synthase [Acetobacteraceae bacterium]|nr:beta-ketoacyl-ACP synthase [Acetobacteraceae bacterium]